jgi:hypothetical protein
MLTHSKFATFVCPFWQGTCRESDLQRSQQSSPTDCRSRHQTIYPPNRSILAAEMVDGEMRDIRADVAMRTYMTVAPQ